MKAFLILTIVTIFSFSSLTFAHPGRTDKYGGHTCKTNCVKRGLKYGQYHYHSKRR